MMTNNAVVYTNLQVSGNPNWQVSLTFVVQINILYAIGKDDPFSNLSNAKVHERLQLTRACQTTTNPDFSHIKEMGVSLVFPNFLMSAYYMNKKKNQLVEDCPSRWDCPKDISAKILIKWNLDTLCRSRNQSFVGLSEKEIEGLLLAYKNFRNNVCQVLTQYVHFYANDCFDHMCKENCTNNDALDLILKSTFGPRKSWNECLKVG